MPGPHFPAQPLNPAIGVRKWVSLIPESLAREAALVHLFPERRDFGEDLVMGAANDAGFPQCIVGTPQAADSHIAHITIEHCDRDRSLLDKPTQPLGILPHGRDRFLLGDVANGSRNPKPCLRGAAADRFARDMQPAHASIGRLCSALDIKLSSLLAHTLELTLPKLPVAGMQCAGYGSK